MNFVAGYIDDNIHYCPYCAERLLYISCLADTRCDKCGKSFCVIEGEQNEEGDHDE